MNPPIMTARDVGTVIHEYTAEPITRTTLALYAGASGDHNPIHIDLDFARQAGFPDVFGQGMLGMAYLGRLMTFVAMPDSWKRFSTRFTNMIQLGDRLRCSAKLVELRDDGTAVLELVAAGQDGQVKLTGTVELALP